MLKNNETAGNDLQLKKDSNEGVLKNYFQKISDLRGSGKEFPVNLDDVWGLAYQRKDHAIRTLKSDFIENVDYQFFLKNGEKSKRGKKGSFVSLFLFTSQTLQRRALRNVKIMRENVKCKIIISKFAE